MLARPRSSPRSINRSIECAHRANGGRRAVHLPFDVFGDELLDDDARLVQHDVAEADAVGDAASPSARAAGAAAISLPGDAAIAVRPKRSSRRAAWPLSGEPRSPLRNRCGAPCFVPPARQAYCRRAGSARRGRNDRFLRRSPAGRRRPDGACASASANGSAVVGDEADQTFAGAHRGQVNRFAVQTFGGKKFEPAVGAQHIDRADFGDHVGRDMDDDLVEACLRADRLRHDLAQAAQQKRGPPPSVLRAVMSLSGGPKTSNSCIGKPSQSKVEL